MRPDEDLPSVKHCARARRARARETHGEAECGACDLPDAGRGGCALERPGLLGIALSSSANTGSDTSPLLLVLLAAIALFILGLLVSGRRSCHVGQAAHHGSRPPGRLRRARHADRERTPIVSAVLYAGIPLGSDRAGR